MKRFANAAIALATFLATCAALHRVLPEPPVENVTPKLRFFAEHKDEFDTLLVGTSRFQHQISPAVFDRVTAENGRATRTFNFGVDGMHPAESFFVTEELLALRPEKLRAVFFELEDVQVDWSREARGTRRLAYWHNWRQTSLTLARAIDPTGRTPWFAKAARVILRSRAIFLHLNLFLHEGANVGRASDLVANHNANERPDWIAQLGPAHDGYQTPLQPMPPQRVPRYEKKLQHEISNAHPRFVDPYAEERFREYAAQFEKLGAHVFFVVTPVVTQSPLRLRAPVPGPVLSFNSAKRYPQLYDPAVRADEAHLSEAAANEFTRLLAQQYIEATR